MDFQRNKKDQMRQKFFEFPTEVEQLSKELSRLRDAFSNDAESSCKKKCYTREFKLKAIKFTKLYTAIPKNRIGKPKTRYAAAKIIGITWSDLNRWLKTEQEIYDMPSGAKIAVKNRQPANKEMEFELTKRFLTTRAQGRRVTKRWFITEAMIVYEQVYPHRMSSDQETGKKIYGSFKFSNNWFTRYKKRNRVSLRAITHRAQITPEDYRASCNNFHFFIRQHADETITGDRKRDVGKFKLGNIANMDQTPLPFDFLDGRTYEPTGSRSVHVKASGSGLDKRQATLQITVFADGKFRVKPVIIFKGKGSAALIQKEKQRWDCRVVVYFDESAWASEAVTLSYLDNEWQFAIDYDADESLFAAKKPPRMFVLDVHRAQKTEAVKKRFAKYNTLMVMVPAGCTAYLQPIDVAINKPLKSYIRNAIDKHYMENKEAWMADKFTASDRRVFMTRWVAEAWEGLKKRPDIVIRAFEK